MNQVTTANGRYYTKPDNKHKYWSVTTVTGMGADFTEYSIKQCLDYVRDHIGKMDMDVNDVLIWASGAHRRKLKECGDRGTNVHDAIEAWLLGNDIPDLTDEELFYWLGWYWHWWSKHDVEVIDLEKRVYKDMWVCDDCLNVTDVLPDDGLCNCGELLTHIGYAGTYDALLKVDGILGKWDWKTSRSIHDNYWEQLSAYDDADDTEIVEVGIVRMKNPTEVKTPRAQVVTKEMSELYEDGHYTTFLKKLLLTCDLKKER